MFLAVSTLSHSQIQNEIVSFDNYVSDTDNDLINKFQHRLTRPNLFTQVNSNGITGGVLVPPNYLNWGNDVLEYCSTYKNIQNSLIETTISFKYNSSIINPNRYERAVVIWLRGSNSNHDVGYYIDRSGLNITTYNYSRSKQMSRLIDGHWYKMVTYYKNIGGQFGDQAFVKVEVYDIGLNGNEPPISIGIHETNIYDIELTSSDNFFIQLAGARWGGAEYLDNFTFSGEKKDDLCANLSNHEVNRRRKKFSYPNPASLQVNIPLNSAQNGVLRVYNISGQMVESININTRNEYYTLSLDKYQSGVYLYEYNEDKGKFIVK